MSTEVINIICNMDMKKIQSQLVLQCAPLIVGLKVSNLFVTEPKYLRALRIILKRSDLSFYVLTSTENKVTCFIFRKKTLEAFLNKKENLCLLKSMGYNENLSLTQKMYEFRRRYRSYQEGLTGFPHEMGVFLGYPAEDVIGFIEKKGQRYLYSGYWKVYEDVDTKKEIFEMYEIAKESLVCLLAGGLSIVEIIEAFCGQHKMAA